MNHHNHYHNTDEPPSTSFLSSDVGGSGAGSGYRYAAYEDDYLYENNDMNRNNNMVGGGMPPGGGNDRSYGQYDNMNDNFMVDDNLSSSTSSHTPSSTSTSSESFYDFNDPKIANLPRILLMGPRRGGKTSIQRVVFQKMSPHETLFRLEATQTLERAVVDHTPLCRFTIWDFPGDFYGQHQYNQQQQLHSSPHLRGDDMYGHHQYHHNNANMNSPNPAGPPGMIIDPTLSSNNSNINNTSSSNNNSSSNNPDTGDHNASSDAHIYTHATALIFVIDAQDEPYDHVLQSFTETVTRAIAANPHVAIEVFINKVDGELFLSDEAKYDCRRDIMQQVSEELHDAGIDDVPVAYHLTSIYDHSVFEAFSRVVQKLIPQLPTLENLLNVLVSTCSMEKAYLFDVASKLYISTDSSPVDMQSVELCSDMIDVVLDVSGIYGLRQQQQQQIQSQEDNEQEKNQQQNKILDGSQRNSTTSSFDGDANPSGNGGGVLSDDLNGSAIGTGLEVITTNNSNNILGEEISSQGDLNPDLIALDGDKDGSIDNEEDEEAEMIGDSAYDSESSSVIRLSNGMVLYLKEVDTMLALVCITRSENFRKKSLINYNISCLKKALKMLVQPPPSPSLEPASPIPDETEQY